MKAVVLAEKPSVARDIARVLKCQKKGNGYLEGDKYIVTWALGHLVTLADPEDYDVMYKEWRIDTLPMLPETLKLVVIKQTGKQFQAVKSQLIRKDVDQVIIATDAGREGELVARWILEKSNCKKPLQRLWISSVTDQAIRDGFRNLQDGKKYKNLYASAVARSEADWLVGLNATRALTTMHNAQLSCGRVQTPTLAMIASREEEIRHFVPKSFYGLSAKHGQVKFIWNDGKTNETRDFRKDRIESIFKNLGKEAVISQIDKKAKKSYAPALYDLTELQRDAHKRFNFTAKETLSIMQQLYEYHKVVTYPRTDSRYLSSDMVGTLRDRVVACVKQFPTAKELLGKPIQANKSFVDNTKVSDHHAIIPTEQPAQLMKMSDRERRIYELVVTRFLAVLSPAFEYEQTIVTAQIGQEKFVAKGRTIHSLGWKTHYQSVDSDDEESNNDEQQLPPFSKGQRISVDVTMTQGETKPPEPFNEATLLSAMENPAKFVTDAKVIQTLQKTGGLGTVATRADIIEKLLNSFLVEKRGKGMHVTSKGRQLLELAPDELRTPVLTGEWEQKLEMIAKGQLKKELFIKEIVSYTNEIVTRIKASEKKFKHDNLTGTPCPECGKMLLEVNGKKGKIRVCQDRECGYRKTISRETNARCPNCHKKLSLAGSGDSQIFTCKCGYREKMSAFQKRVGNKNSTNASKNDVAKYMRTQTKVDDTTNNPFASALANWGKE
ncbi:MAG: topoisomerase [Bacillales bacterium]|jgi:DNA topoisomerase-3|nr:topoisomerase [Bacillales bacterium]